MLKNGFGSVLVLLGLALILASAFFVLRFSSKNTKNSQTPIVQEQTKSVVSPSPEINSNEPPLKLKTIGINLDYYDPKTGKAGDLVFTKQKLQFGRLLTPYGFFIPGSSASPAKKNPQPTFIAPIGTPVHSLVDGTVANIGTLWSGDVSIQVTANGQIQKWVYETEHVNNPKVKVGDHVTAGQVIAEVSSFDKQLPAGFGAVEIGILKGGNPPQHVCPFAYLDPSIRDETFKKISALFKSWEEYIGDPTLYDESNNPPGCITSDAIDG